MNCQKCRTPLKLDGSLADLNPAAFDLLVGKSSLYGLVVSLFSLISPSLNLDVSPRLTLLSLEFYRFHVTATTQAALIITTFLPSRQ